MTQLTRVRPLFNASDQVLRDEADKGFTRIYSAHEALNSTAIKAPVNGQGFMGQHGSTVVTGTKLGVVTGMTQVSRVIPGINSDGVALNMWATARPSKSVRGGIDLFVYQPTAAGNNTPVLATSPVLVEWWALGS